MKVSKFRRVKNIRTFEITEADVVAWFERHGINIENIELGEGSGFHGDFWTRDGMQFNIRIQSPGRKVPVRIPCDVRLDNFSRLIVAVVESSTGESLDRTSVDIRRSSEDGGLVVLAAKSTDAV